MGTVSETPTPTTCLKSTAVHLPFVRQYAPHLYRRTFLASKLRRKGNPAIRLPFVLQYASHLYGSTPPICTAVLLEKYWGLGLSAPKSPNAEIASDFRVDGAKSPEIPQRGFALGNRSPKSQIASAFHRTLKSQRGIALSCLQNRSDFLGPRWASQSQIPKIAAISVR